MLNSIQANFLNISKKITPSANIAQKLTLLGLVLVLACPMVLKPMTGLQRGWSALSDRMSTAWGRATATREGRIGTAVVLTVAGIAVSYSLYRAFLEYHNKQKMAIAEKITKGLAASVKSGNVAAARAISAQGVDVIKEAVDSGNLTVIIAAIEGYTGQSDLNQYDGNGKTVLIYAILNGDSNLVNQLLNSGANANQADKDGFTPLMYLAQVAHKYEQVAQIAQLLISKAISQAAYVNQSGPLGVNALNLALLAYNNLSTGLLTGIRHSDTISQQQKNIISFIKILLEHDAKITERQITHPIVKLILEAAINADDLALVTKLVNQGAEVNLAGEHNFTPLIYLAQHAAKCKNIGAMAELLIERVSDKKTYVNQQVDIEITPVVVSALIVALKAYDQANVLADSKTVQDNISAFIKVLLKYGAALEGEVSIRQRIKNHPAIKRVQAENQALYFKLIHGTNSSKGAYESNWQQVDDLLISNLVDVNAVDEFGYTGLMIATERVNLAMVRCLLNHGANVCVRNRDNNFTPIMYISYLYEGDEFYDESAALEIIKLLNQAELALVAHATSDGASIASSPVAPNATDERFFRLIRKAFAPELAVKFIACYIRSKNIKNGQV